MKAVIVMNREKECVHSVRFVAPRNADGTKQAVDNVYVNRDASPAVKTAQSVTVTVEIPE